MSSILRPRRFSERLIDDSSGTNTTTKISIDINPTVNKCIVDRTTFSKFPSTGSDLKSTSLIMRTIHNTNETNGHSNPKPEYLFTHLNQLRKLYEDADSDDSARADEEVKGYLGQLHDRNGSAEPADACSAVSGSWSRIRTYREQNHKHKFQEESGIIKQIRDDAESTRFSVNRGYIVIKLYVLYANTN